MRWYLLFGLSYRDVEERLAERGIEVDHVAVYRWVQRFTPLAGDLHIGLIHVPAIADRVAARSGRVNDDARTYRRVAAAFTELAQVI